MSKYDCEKRDIDTVDYCCMRHFAETVIEELFDTDEDASTTIVVFGDMLDDLIRLMMTVQAEGEDEFFFHTGMIDINNVEYDKEYYVTINTNRELWCEPAFHDNEYGTGYILTDDTHVYLYEDCNYSILDKVYSDDVIIFGFEDELDEDD